MLALLFRYKLWILLFFLISAGRVHAGQKIWILREKSEDTIFLVDGKKYSLSKLYEDLRVGRDDSFDVIFEDLVPFSRVAALRGVLEKKGSLDIRYFVFSKGGDRMMEVRMGDVLPLPK